VLKRYSLASGSRKLMYGTGSGVSQDIQNTFPAERNGEREEKSSISDLFPLTSPSRQNLFHPVFSDLVYIGALWDTYLIFPASDGMLLIDQHAAHERVLFEKIKGGAEIKKTTVQTLLLPEVLNLAKPDFERFTAMSPLLEQVGIEAESFGADAVVIKALPALLAHLDPGAIVRDLISEFSEKEGELSLQEKSDKIYALVACKGAVKAGHPLTRKEVEQLCRHLDATPFAATCPHGRPVYIMYSLRDIERMFRRR